MEKVIVYIDGFNLYYGMKNKGWKRYYWLNLDALARRILKPGQQLVEIKYFTARISTTDKNKKKRQDTYIDALKTLPDLHIFYGHYLHKQVHCGYCNRDWRIPEEKMTDVRIATELIFDAYDNRFDAAIIISGDSDLVPPIDRVKKQFPHKIIGLAFPPARESNALKKYADYHFVISRTALRKSVFTDKVKGRSGVILERPAEWK